MRYRLGDPDRRIEPWSDARAIEDTESLTSGTDPAIIAWTTRGGDPETPQKIVDALNNLTWRPIEIAPRDGTFIIVAGPSGYVTTPLRVEVCRMRPNYKVGRWINHGNDDFTDGGEEPTLWMPLP